MVFIFTQRNLSFDQKFQWYILFWNFIVVIGKKIEKRYKICKDIKKCVSIILNSYKSFTLKELTISEVIVYLMKLVYTKNKLVKPQNECLITAFVSKVN